MCEQIVLIVDDDNEFRELVAMIVEAKGYRPSEAFDGVDALSKLELAPLPDLIMLDLRMPRMNGIEFLEAVRLAPATRSIPVIALSGDIGAADAAIRAGANAFLRKPVAARTLLDAIAAHVAPHAAQNAAEQHGHR